MIIILINYKNLHAKYYEKFRQSEDSIIDHDLSITSFLPNRYAILKSKKNKQKLENILHTSIVDEYVTMDTRDECVFINDAADGNMVSFLEAAHSGNPVVRVFSDGTDVFCCSYIGSIEPTFCAGREWGDGKKHCHILTQLVPT